MGKLGPASDKAVAQRALKDKKPTGFSVRDALNAGRAFGQASPGFVQAVDTFGGLADALGKRKRKKRRSGELVSDTLQTRGISNGFDPSKLA